MKKEVKLAIIACKKAGKYLRKQKKILIENDFEKDIKLDVDYKAEEIILKILKKTEHNLLSEELGEIKRNEKELVWIIDPLDGSLNFSRNIPLSVVSIALYKRLEPLFGVVYDFNRRDLYLGIINQGAYLNNKKIKVSNTKKVSKSIISTGFPTQGSFSKTNLQKEIKYVKNYKKVRLFGTAALSLCLLAKGCVEAYKEEGIMLWDVAAGLAIVKAAGGKISIKKTKGKHQYAVWASNGKTS